MTVISRFRAWIDEAAQLVLPVRCASCDAPATGDQPFCRACSETLEEIRAPCERCGCPGQQPTCRPCRRRPPTFSRALFPFEYGGELAVALRRLKYQRQPHLARALGHLLDPIVRRIPASRRPDRVVPVPLHRRRLKERGFNQSTLLARQVCRDRRLTLCCGALARLRDTPPQSQHLCREARRRNVEGAFRARPHLVAGRRILLVDDILTTGATAEACAEALLAAGAKDVMVAAVARVSVSRGE